MEPLVRLLEISDKTAPGVTPDFMPAHVWKTIMLLNEVSMGRKSLSEKLCLGEGTVRNIVKRLRDERFITTSKTGMKLTKQGHEFYLELKKYLRGIRFPFDGLTVERENYAVLVINGASKINFGVEQRDAALLSGAEGATTVINRTGELVLPGMIRVLEDLQRDFLIKSLDPGNGDAIIIGSDKSQLNAEIGAISSALTLYMT
jgi:hypothetical protein